MSSSLTFHLGDALILTTKLLLHNHYFLRQHLVLMFSIAASLDTNILVQHKSASGTCDFIILSCTNWRGDIDYSPYPGMPSKGEIIHVHHICRSSLIKIFLVSYATCSDFHRGIPTLLFEQLSWAIIATSTELKKKKKQTKKHPSPQKKNK